MSFSHLLVSQDKDEIYLIFGTYSHRYYEFVKGTTKTTRDYLHMHLQRVVINSDDDNFKELGVQDSGNTLQDAAVDSQPLDRFVLRTAIHPRAPIFENLSQNF